MKVLIVVESWFGNTRKIADAIARGVTGASLHCDARVVSVEKASDALTDDIDLLVVAAPTHNMGLSSETSRSRAAEQGAVNPPTTGIREWIAGLDDGGSRPSAITVDTSFQGGTLFGSASKATNRLLKGKGFAPVHKGESFLIGEGSNELVDGELRRAEHWGSKLPRLIG